MARILRRRLRPDFRAAPQTATDWHFTTQPPQPPGHQTSHRHPQSGDQRKADGLVTIGRSVRAYNPEPMRRGLIAIFCLQLIWNMAAYSVMGYDSASSAVPTVSLSVADVHATPGKGLIDKAHGLADELPDLPDSAAPRSTPRLIHPLEPLHPLVVPAGLPLPMLDGLLRPPRLG